MGVKGFTAFIDDNPSLLKDYRLHDCKVILDGNNFIHFVYQKYNSGFQYDGDFFNYCSKIMQLFNNLKTCNVVPFVIFDGGYDISDSKLKTVMHRAETRVAQATKRTSLVPMLANKAFLKVLDKLEVAHVTCSFEADEEIAILANQWGCPVISNDSDFFIYELTAGFLPLNYVDFRPIQSEENFQYVPAQKYHFNHYRDILDNFQPKMIPLLATVLGNDFIKRDTFANFTEKFLKLKYKIKNASKSVSKITAIISHLDKFVSFDEGKAAITSNIETSGGLASLQHVLNKSINSYTKIKSTSSVMAEYFSNNLNFSSISRKDYFGRPFPDWLIKDLFTGKVSPDFQNMALLHRLILRCQQENIKQKSSHNISSHIRLVLYGIIFQSAEGKVENKSNKKEKATVTRKTHLEEIDRNKSGIFKNYINPRIGITKYGRIPSLADIEYLTNSSRRSLILRTLGVSEKLLSSFCESDRLLMSVLSYWVYHAEVSKLQLEALILTIILLKIKNLVNDDNSYCNSNCKQKSSINILKSVISHLTFAVKHFSSLLIPFRKRCLDVDNTLKTLNNSDYININIEFSHKIEPRNKSFRPDTLSIEELHVYCQYQSCLYFTLLLNTVLRSPFPEPAMWEIYDGLCVHHFTQCLTWRKSGCYGDVDVLLMMENYPELIHLYKSIAQVVWTDAKSRPEKLTKSQKRARAKTRQSKYVMSLLLMLFVGIVLFVTIALAISFDKPLLYFLN